jgi:hypothetical protein
MEVVTSLTASYLRTAKTAAAGPGRVLAVSLSSFIFQIQLPQDCQTPLRSTPGARMHSQIHTRLSVTT